MSEVPYRDCKIYILIESGAAAERLFKSIRVSVC